MTEDADRPQHVLAESPLGNTDVMVGSEKGHVFLRFPKPVPFLICQPKNAVGIAKCMIDNAQICGLDVMIELPRREVTLQMRDRLIARMALTLQSLYERKRTPGQIAIELVDICLRDLT